MHEFVVENSIGTLVRLDTDIEMEECVDIRKQRWQTERSSQAMLLEQSGPHY
jgi:hypothetical protein